ncbi:MAG: hypothetical protein AVDCRST_MAG40-538, partial [uncultured Gemmatimonadaceae bacterium]
MQWVCIFSGRAPAMQPWPLAPGSGAARRGSLNMTGVGNPIRGGGVTRRGCVRSADLVPAMGRWLALAALGCAHGGEGA